MSESLSAGSTAVVGLGKLGLPIAVRFAASTNVVGFDIDQERVSVVNQGHEPFPGEQDLASRLRDAVDQATFRATTDPADAIGASDRVIVTVPLLDRAGVPDYVHIDRAIDELAPHLRSGTLVVFETTLPVGATRKRLAPRLAAASGREVGSTLFVAHSPERVTTGRVFRDLRRYPKLVGGVTAACGTRAAEFYRKVLDFDARPDLARDNGVWLLASSDEAEFAKLAETTYRNVNIALANEFALFAQQNEMNVYDVIEASNSQPFSHIHQPGASVGGHCIPVYPYLYLDGDPGAVLPRASTGLNESMPDRTVAMLDAFEPGWLSGATIVVLGLAYRPAVKASDRSGTFDVVRSLEARGATVVVDDPLFSDAEITGLGLRPLSGEQPAGAILHTAHPEYERLSPSDLPSVTRVVDGRRCLDPAAWATVELVQLGIGSI